MSTARRLPTSADVARRAGVSRSTVSYVLNDTPGARIPEATRDRVLAAAAELGYVANRAAADLRRGTSRIVLGALDEERAGSLASQYVGAFTRVFHDAGFTLVTTVASGAVAEREAYEWAELRPMAILAFGVRLAPPARDILSAAGCVVIGDQDGDVLLDVDQAAVARAGVEALRSRGRSRLLQVLPADESLAELTRTRVSAFDEAAGPDGLGTRRIGLGGDSARALVEELSSWPVRPDGIVAHNDEYAALLLGQLLDAGVSVPADVAVIGADDTPWGRWMRPALSTLVLEQRSITEQLVEVLTAIGEGREHARTLPVELSIRAEHRQTT